MITIKTKDGDSMLMFGNGHCKFKIVSLNLGEFGDGYGVFFCRKNPSGKGLIIEDEPKVGLFFVACRYSEDGLRYKFVSKEIVEIVGDFSDINTRNT